MYNRNHQGEDVASQETLVWDQTANFHLVSGSTKSENFTSNEILFVIRVKKLNIQYTARICGYHTFNCTHLGLKFETNIKVWWCRTTRYENTDALGTHSSKEIMRQQLTIFWNLPNIYKKEVDTSMNEGREMIRIGSNYKLLGFIPNHSLRHL